MAILGGDGTITLRTKVDQGGLNKGMASLKGAITKLGVAIGVAFGVRALVQFGKQAVQLASDLEEVQNVVDVAFGDMAYKMEQFADTAIETYGISKLTAKRTGSTYMAMAKGMGMAGEQAADMSLSLTALSADMASFFNKSQEMTDIALKAVFTGETEVLKQYGIVMTQVNLQEFARQQGITKTIDKMNQQEQVMLRYNYIMQQTALTQGDFVRTQDSWANQTRILAERWKEMQTVFGQAFMTIGVLVLPVINNIIVGLTKVAQAAQVVAQWIYKAFTGKELKSSTNATQSQATALSGVGSSAESAADGMADLGSSTKKANKEAKKALAGFDDLEIITSNLADSAVSAAGSMGEIGGGIGAMDTNVDFSTEGEAPDTTWLDTFSEKLEPAREALARLAEQLQPLKEFSSQALQDFYDLFLVPVGDWILGEGFPRFVDAISKQLALVNWSMLNGALADLWKSVTPFAINVGEGLLWFWENVITPMIGWALNNLIPASIDLITAAIEFLNEIITAAKPALIWIWDTFFVPLRDYLWDIVIDFIELLTQTFERLTNWAKNNQETIENVATAIIGFMAGMWFYNSTVMLISFVKGVGEALIIMAGGMDIAGVSASFAAGAFSILAAAILLIWKNWDKMTGWEKVISVIGALSIAAAAAAAAVGALQSAWSLGIAAAAIAAGIVAIGISINAATKRAKQDLAAFGGDTSTSGGGSRTISGGGTRIPGLARGAVLPPNKPFMAMVGDQTNGTNIEAPIDTIKQALLEVMQTNGGGNQPIIIEVDGREFGKAVLSHGNRESHRTSGKLVFG